MFWIYLFLLVSAIGHLICAFYLLKISRERKWAAKGLFLGVIAVWQYKKETSSG